MNLQKNLTKKISFLLIISVLSINLSFLTVPKQIEASGFPVVDIAGNIVKVANFVWEKGRPIIVALAIKTAKIAARKLISNIARATVDWINGGGKGQPAFMGKNFDQFMFGKGGVADQTMGDFFRDTSLNFLCAPFQQQVKLALQLGYGANLKDKIGCTLSGIATNINNAADNSTVTFDLNGNPITRNYKNIANNNDGGWGEWLKTTMEPQNNPIGAYVSAKIEMDDKILKAIGVKKEDLSWGSGALTFKRCVDTYYDENNNELSPQSSEYTEGAGGKGRPPIPPFSGHVTREQECVTKTPGATITNMLGFKATSDQRMNELTASMADGLDAIFNALINQLLKGALGQLNKGILDSNVDDYTAYNIALDKEWKNAVDQYNTDMTNLNNEQTDLYNSTWVEPTQVTPPDQPLFPPSNPPLFPDPITPPYNPNGPFSSSTPYNPIIPYSSTTPYYPFGPYATSTPEVVTPNVIPGYSALDQAKNNANTLLNSLSKSEATYQNSFMTAQNVLIEGQKAFATSSACNIGYNNPNSILRSLLIRANVISNIDGVKNSDRTIASIPWNLAKIKVVMDDSSAKMAILSKAASGVSGAGSITAVIDAMIQVNSTSFNTDPQSKMVGDIKTWLRGVQSMYNSTTCPIDLVKVLQITTPASK